MNLYSIHRRKHGILYIYSLGADKLRLLCDLALKFDFFRDLERKIVEAEMELTLAKSQGFLKNQLKQSGSSSGKRLLAVIGVYTGFGSRLKRNVFRGSWMPKGKSLVILQKYGGNCNQY